MARSVNSFENRHQREIMHRNHCICHRKMWVNKAFVVDYTYNINTYQSLTTVIYSINIDLIAKNDIYDIFLKRHYLCSAQKDLNATR